MLLLYFNFVLKQRVNFTMASFCSKKFEGAKLQEPIKFHNSYKLNYRDISAQMLAKLNGGFSAMCQMIVPLCHLFNEIDLRFEVKSHIFIELIRRSSCAVDFNFRTGMIFWSDVMTQKIYK